MGASRHGGNCPHDKAPQQHKNRPARRESCLISHPSQYPSSKKPSLPIHLVACDRIMNTIVVRKERIDACNEDPPTYSPPPQLPTGRAPLPLTTKPCNNVSVTRQEGDITGVFVIDPTITILAALWPSKAVDKNLSLTASSGKADVDIYLVTGGRGRVTKSKTKLNVLAQSDIVVRLVSVLGRFVQFLLDVMLSLCVLYNSAGIWNGEKSIPLPRCNITVWFRHCAYSARFRRHNDFPGSNESSKNTR